MTKAIREAARTIDVEFLDHVIVGRANVDPTGVGFYSFRQAGLL